MSERSKESLVRELIELRAESARLRAEVAMLYAHSFGWPALLGERDVLRAEVTRLTALLATAVAGMEER